MLTSLIIVESPAKARTLKRFLGNGYDVRASMGHVRDLPERELAVDVERGFRPSYELVESRKRTIGELKSALKKEREVILASDPDREGEAIAWHLAEVLRLKDPKRIEFHEVTADAVRQALAHPREIDMKRVNAQQARRVVDRLVGYKLSPFLWNKVQKGISAGRVQSVAVRLVCDREEEIRSFVPVESWTLDASLSKAGGNLRFTGRLARRRQAGQADEGKIELGDRAAVDAVLRELDGAEYRVVGVEEKRRTKSAPRPYITSTLQQDASSRLRFPVKKTMRLAQELYEGVDLGPGGATGLITYMRTDSTRISEDADRRVRAWIREHLGAEYAGGVRADKSRANAQEAHEAIRPTDPGRRPEDVRAYLSSEQFRLYELIWRRFVASRMADAVYSGNQAEIAAGDLVFRASGVVLTFDGFYRIWERDDKDESRLPELREGEVLVLHELTPEQHFTQPPPRYSEATLVKELEERGIGRPSTYASIVSVIQERGYVDQRERRLHPTPLGEAVNGIMVDHFGEIVDDAYTARMETRLDEIEERGHDWEPIVAAFYGPLERMLSAAEEAIPAHTGEDCPECHQGHLVRRASRFGPFLGCDRYPKCKYRQPLETATEAPPAPELLDDKCPECGRRLQKRTGRFGEFVGCSGYPECRYIRREERAAPKLTGRTCPRCGKHELVERQGRYGTFLACSGYPDCSYRENVGGDRRRGRGRAPSGDGATRPEPQVLEEQCPVCGKPLVLRQGRWGPFKSCSDYPRCKGPQRPKPATKAG